MRSLLFYKNTLTHLQQCGISKFSITTSEGSLGGEGRGRDRSGRRQEREKKGIREGGVNPAYNAVHPPPMLYLSVRRGLSQSVVGRFWLWLLNCGTSSPATSPLPSLWLLYRQLKTFLFCVSYLDS